MKTTTTTHTPGPWTAHHGWARNPDIVKEHPHWCEVTAEGYTPDGYLLRISGHFGMANARLIAAAPELLAAAIAALTIVLRDQPEGSIAHDLRAAIAKATGA